MGWRQALFGVVTPARVAALVLVMGASYLGGCAPGAAADVTASVIAQCT